MLTDVYETPPHSHCTNKRIPELLNPHPMLTSARPRTRIGLEFFEVLISFLNNYLLVMKEEDLT